MKAFFKILLYILGICLLIELISGDLSKSIKGYFHMNSNNLANEIPDTNRISHIIPNDYLKLLNLKVGCCDDSTENKFYFSKTVESKFRNQISFFIYNKKYYLQIYKMDTLCRLSLNNAIKESYNNAKEPFYTYYAADVESAIEYGYKLSLPSKPQNIYLKLNGKNNRIILKNDSIVYYYSMFRKFSIQYKQTEFDDIYGKTDEGMFSANYQPLEILFLKRDNNLYLLIMSVYKEGEKYSPGMLYDIVRSK